MKRIFLYFLAFLFCLGCLPSTSLAASTLIQGKDPNNALKDIAVKYGGEIATADSDIARDRDLSLTWAAINDSATVGGPADSTTTAQYVAPYGRLFLHIHCAGGGTYSAMTWAKFAFRVSFSPVQVINTTNFVPLGFPRSAAMTADSTSMQFGSIAGGTTITPFPDEIVVTVNMANGAAGIDVPIFDRGGGLGWGQWMVLRGRLIAVSTAAAGIPAPWVSYQVNVLGRPF